MWSNYCTNSHSYWFWPVGFFIFLAVFFTVSRLFWWGGRYHRFGLRNGDPLQLAKARYAAGKINKEELDAIKKELDK